METITYGQGALLIPDDAVRVTVTPYLWPSHYAEWDGEDLRVWELVSRDSWRETWGTLAPPLQAVKGATVLRWRYRLARGDPLGAQEVHAELRQSSLLPDLCLIDPHKEALALQPTHLAPLAPQQTHLALPQTHPSPLSKHPSPLQTHLAPLAQKSKHPAHPALKSTHPAPQQTHPGPMTKKEAEPVAEQSMVVLKEEQQAVWRTHTRIHTRIHT